MCIWDHRQLGLGGSEWRVRGDPNFIVHLSRTRKFLDDGAECVRGRTRPKAESPYCASVVHQECELLVERHVAKMAANSQC